MQVVSRRKAALATFAGSGLCTLIAGIQSILFVPLYIHAVGAETYGIWLATGEMLLWLVAFDCGLPNMMVQRIGSAHSKGELKSTGVFFVAGFALLCAIALLLGAVAWFAAPTVVQALSKTHQADGSIIQALQIAAVAIVLALVGYGFQGLARALQKTEVLSGFAVASTLAGLFTTLLLIQGGYGVQAIAIGLVVRNGGSLLGGLIFLLFDRACQPIRSSIRFSPKVAKEFLAETPLQLSSGLAYALMNNSQVTLAAVLIRPEAAVVFGVTRKIAEFVKAMLDMVGYATEGAFGHLFASGDTEQTFKTQRHIDFLLIAIGATFLTGYVAANQGFVKLWMGQTYLTGVTLTAALAVGTLASAWGYLGVTRLRATGEFRTAAKLLLADCLSRVCLMAAGGWIAGLNGIAFGAILPPIVIGIMARKRLILKIGGVTGSPGLTVASTAFAIGVGVSFVAQPSSYGHLALTVLLTTAITAIGFAVTNRQGQIPPRLQFAARRRSAA